MRSISIALDFQPLCPQIEETRCKQLRTAIRHRIIETDRAAFVQAGTAAMSDYKLVEFFQNFRSVMTKGTDYETKQGFPALSHHHGFAPLTDNTRGPLRMAITRAVRHGLLRCEGSAIWRG